jgi:hypothetical protein
MVTSSISSCDDEAAINVVNLQTASERQVPFSICSVLNGTAYMTRLQFQMKMEFGLGNNINLNRLLTRPGNIFLLQVRCKMTRPMTTHSKQLVLLLTHMLCNSSPGTSQRHAKPTWGMTSLNGENISKMLDTLTLANHLCWIAFSGHSTTLSPKSEASRSFCLITDLRQ